MNFLNSEAKVWVSSLISLCVLFCFPLKLAGFYHCLVVQNTYCLLLLEMGKKNIQTFQDRRCKGWKQAVLYLHFPNVEGWWWFQMRACTRVSLEWRGPLKRVSLNGFKHFAVLLWTWVGEKNLKCLFEQQHLLRHLTEETNIHVRKPSSRYARGHIIQEANRSYK